MLASRPTPSLRRAAVDHDQRLREVAIIAVLGAWLVYTRLYFVLHTFDPSLFMLSTGKPDPTCGLTRTFAYTWVGDLQHAVLVYPIGPVVFLASILVLARSLVVVIARQRVELMVPPSFRRWIIGATVVAVAANWLSKLIWLGM